MSRTAPATEQLIAALDRVAPFALAFSGGLDSRFLAHIALLHGLEFKLYHICGPHVPEAESAWAVQWAKARNLPCTVLHLDPLTVPEVRAGGKDRCYGCKLNLFGVIAGIANQEGFANLCDGSNASDKLAYRPGVRALRELGVHSPLAEVGLDKKAIRKLAAATGMDHPGQPARPCLLTRYAYGLCPDQVSLLALARAENSIATLMATACRRKELKKIPDYRLRLIEKAPGASLPFVVELHLEHALPRQLATALADAAQAEGFTRPDVKVVETLSGFYDQPVDWNSQGSTDY